MANLRVNLDTAVYAVLNVAAVTNEATGGVFDQSSRFGDLARLWREKVLDAQVMAPSTRAAALWVTRNTLPHLTPRHLPYPGTVRVGD